MAYGLDSYGLQARLRPALLALFPAFITVAIWFPNIYKTASSLIGLAVACGMTVILGQFVRNQGLRVQDKLVAEWGGMPTTIALRHLDSSIDDTTKARYHAFLEDNIPNWETPTRTEELESKKDTDGRYLSAVRWLREYTRDTKKYPLVFNENISYGFRRNAYGIKYFAIALCLAVILFIGKAMMAFSADQILSAKLSYTLTAIVSLGLLLWWIFCVTKTSVLSAAKAYSRALLAVCEG